MHEKEKIRIKTIRQEISHVIHIRTHTHTLFIILYYILRIAVVGRTEREKSMAKYFDSRDTERDPSERLPILTVDVLCFIRYFELSISAATSEIHLFFYVIRLFP